MNCIKLNALELNVKLGWPKDERSTEQMVLIDIIIDFIDPLPACQTDQLADTYCYHNLINLMKTFVKERNFRLIEHLGYELYQVIKKAIPTNTRIQLCTTKKPPITELTRGVTFCYGDS